MIRYHSCLRAVAWMLALTLLSACLFSCKGEGETEGEEYLRFVDSTGETVVLSHRPIRVAVLFSSFAEMWQLAGGTVAVSVGESIERGFCPSDTPLVDAGAGKTVNAEQLIAHRPDFVIASADVAAQSNAVQLLREAGIPCARFRVESFADYLSVFETMTLITGDGEAYERYGLAVKREIDTLKNTYGECDGGSILFIRAGSSARSTKAKNSEGHFAAAMLEELGCSNLANRAPILMDGLSIEEILSCDPDRIFVTTMGDEDAAVAYWESLVSSKAWQSLSAVKEGRVYLLPKALFQFKPNARWGEAYRYLAEILYETDSHTNQ